jgi:ComF family protein
MAETAGNDGNPLKKWVGHLLELFFPADCQACKNELGSSKVPFFCESCWSGIQPIEGPLCPQCGRPFSSSIALAYSPGHRCGDCRAHPPHFDNVTTPYPYEGTLAKGISLFKYQRQVSLVDPMMKLATPFLHSLERAEVILPVPLHRARLKKREFNQSLILADALGKLLKKPTLGHLLVKVSHTDRQVRLSRRLRRKNLEKSLMILDEKAVSGKNVLLVDDVFTTGSTLNECARVLKKAGSREVYGFALARTLLKRPPG